MHKIITNTILILLAVAFTLSSCSQQTVSFQKSSAIPAAELDLQIGRDDNGNYTIDLEVKNMAKPSALTPDREAYVVWVRSAQGDFNLGQLKINDKLKGELEAATVYKPEMIFITAENNIKATQPDKQVIAESQQPEFE